MGSSRGVKPLLNIAPVPLSFYKERGTKGVRLFYYQLVLISYRHCLRIVLISQLQGILNSYLLSLTSGYWWYNMKLL
jgi:hypothetical protein